MSSGSVRVELPESIRSLLRRVRNRIRRDSFADGVLLLISGMISVFWGTKLLDLGWFLLQTMELPVGLRAILLSIMLPALVWFTGRRVIYPLVRRIRDLDIALLVERRFPQFRDRLVTTVESAAGLPREGSLTEPMLQRAVNQAELLAGSVQDADVFRTESIRRMMLVAGSLVASLVAGALLDPQLLPDWWNAFVRCEEVYHTRSTDLDVVALARPGDRRIEFSDLNGQLTYRHPRSADLDLEFFVPERNPDEGPAWRIPDRIRVDLIRMDGSRSRKYVSPTSPGTFRYSVTQLREPVELEVLAGDYRTRVPWRVDIVETPGLDELSVVCTYPEYTGWNQQRERVLKITGSDLQLPVGTQFELTAVSAKRLQSARIVTDQFELSGDLVSSEVRFPDGRVVRNASKPLLNSDGLRIQAGLKIELPVQESPETSDESKDSRSGAAETGSGDGDMASAGHLTISASSNLRFFLHDVDDVMSVSPETLHVQGIEDASPVIVAQMTGIGNSITRRARIPVAGRIRDDYGLIQAGFEFQVDDETAWRPRPFRKGPEDKVTDFSMSRSESEPWEYFEVEPLDLSEGQSLTLTVVASDGNPAAQGQLTRGTALPFQIVSDEELLSVLYTREIALRTRFEELIAQLDEVDKDLSFQKQIAERVEKAGSEAAEEDHVSLATCATRSGNSLRRQSNELLSIVEGFEEIVRQLQNNAIPLHNAEAMQIGIVDPLKAVASGLLKDTDRSLGAFRVAAVERTRCLTLVNESQSRVSQVIAELRRILENVRDMAEFHEALRDLKQLSDEQRKIFEETRKLQKNQFFDDLLK